jgi:SAM-dependent methyltransferase
MKALKDYGSYDEYLLHQAKKAKKVKGPLSAKRRERVLWFKERFRGLFPVHKKPVICLGARFGEEVEALQLLGFKGALGIDIEPYPPFVVAGDMNNLYLPDKSVSVVYTNSIDHCWFVPDFLRGIDRVLMSGGIAMFHLAPGGDAGAGRYESWLIESPEEITASIGYGVIKSLPIKAFHGLTYELILEKPCRKSVN